ncbi:MAG TPA: GDP-L-fucose synthase [Terracidiphilus sp.]|nr:GDP-L-fucose synthase [Nitrospira sp.]HEV2483996.1 GDP-L-fucose synthase [Terracidiphilus sp.]
MIDLANKRIVVTGGAGFLGRHLIRRLERAGCHNVIVPIHKEYDFTRIDAIERLFADHKPEVLVHMAAAVGGIGANRENPGRFFYENAIMGIQLIEAARRYEVEKTVVLGTICAYPKFTPVPFREEALWDGYPEETNAPYGLAKKMMLVQCQANREQYGMNAIFLLPVNLYGPGDNFDLESSHVIPALIRKCVEAVKAGSKEIVLWGDGSPTREFLYVEDAVEGIFLATTQYDKSEPVNLGSGMEVSIRNLAATIAEMTGFTGEIVWDTSKPNGQPRRCLDVTRAEQEFKFRAVTPFDAGLRKTIDWYLGVTKSQESQSRELL